MLVRPARCESYERNPSIFDPGASIKQTRRFLDGVGFDWTVVLVGSWLVGGVYLDAWAHDHTTIETFFTPWHAVLYSGYLAVTARLVFGLVRNRARGIAWRDALPAGYGVSPVGASVFLVGGLGDMLWHIVFGIEVDTDGLLSPTHLVLATGGILLMTGPLRAAWLRPAHQTVDERLASLLPALLSAGIALSALFTFSEYANAFASPWAEAAHRTNPADLGQSLGVTSILLQTVLLMGFTFVLMRRWQLPFGRLTLLFTVSGLLTVIPHSQFLFLPVALISGVVGDVAYRWLQPRGTQATRTRAFAPLVSVATVASSFLAIAIGGGIGWSVHLWAGSIALAGVAGWLISYVAMPPAIRSVAA